MLVLATVVGVLSGAAVTAGWLRSRAEPSGFDNVRRTVPVPGVRAVLEALPVAVLVVDVADEVLLGNRAARDLGLVRDGVLANMPALRRLVRRTRHDMTSQQEDLHMASGRGPAVLLARATPVGDGTVAVLLEDVSEARRLEDVRRDFVANVSHELKTPVGALGLLAEALQDASDEAVSVRRFAAQAQQEAQRLGRLVQELIDLSRLEGADPLPASHRVDIQGVIREALDTTRTAATARGVDLRCAVTTGLAVTGSERQLVTAVVNLLDNAISHSGESSVVTVTAEAVRGDIEIRVRDEGVGIPAKDLDRVFERFYRGDPARSRTTGGSGLGLAIVKHIAVNHGGRVSVSSIEGSGATFTVRLPAALRETVTA